MARARPPLALCFTSRLDWLGSVCVGKLVGGRQSSKKRVEFRLSCTVVVVQRQTDGYKNLHSHIVSYFGNGRRASARLPKICVPTFLPC